jgi:hypothetical protein
VAGLLFHQSIIAVELLYHVKKQILACVTIKNYGYIYNLETARSMVAAEKGDGCYSIYKLCAIIMNASSINIKLKIPI